MADAEARPRGPGTRALRRAGSFLLALSPPVAWMLVLAWAGLIWTLSASPVPGAHGQGWIWELLSNLVHAPLFGILALFIGAACLAPRAGPPAWPVFRGARVALVLALVCGYGVFDEWHQSLTPGRDPSALDILTDLTGASAVLWIVFYLARGDASEGGLWRRLGLGALLSVMAAVLATLE